MRWEPGQIKLQWPKQVPVKDDSTGISYDLTAAKVFRRKDDEPWVQIRPRSINPGAVYVPKPRKRRTVWTFKVEYADGMVMMTDPITIEVVRRMET